MTIRRLELLAVVAALPALLGIGATSASAETARTTVVASAVALAAAETVLVARRDLERGVTLSNADVKLVVRDAPPSRRDMPRPAIGWVTRRVVREGETLRPPTVAPPEVIRAGGPVTVVWTIDGIRVTREGTALGAAQLGDRVIVRLDAQRRVTAIATGPGLVVVP